MIFSGRISEAINAIQSLYPGLLEQNQDLFFKLKCRQFVEMVNGCDGEVKTYAHSSPSRSLRNSPSASPSHSFSGNSAQFHRQQQHSNSDFNAADVNGTSSTTTESVNNQQNGNNDEVTNMIVDSSTTNDTDNCDCPTGDDMTTTTTNGQQQDVMMDTGDDSINHQASASSSTSTTVPVITNSNKGIFCYIFVTII